MDFDHFLWLPVVERAAYLRDTLVVVLVIFVDLGEGPPVVITNSLTFANLI